MLLHFFYLILGLTLLFLSSASLHWLLTLYRGNWHLQFFPKSQSKRDLDPGSSLLLSACLFRPFVLSPASLSAEKSTATLTAAVHVLKVCENPHLQWHLSYLPLLDVFILGGRKSLSCRKQEQHLILYVCLFCCFYYYKSSFLILSIHKKDKYTAVIKVISQYSLNKVHLCYFY